MKLARIEVLFYRLYERHLRARLTAGTLPSHVGLVIDGNRRWAREMGMANPSLGHRYGAEHIEHVLGWCRDLGIDHVTVYLASVDNLQRRDPQEVAYLLNVIETLVTERLAQPSSGWQIHVAGRLDALPDSTAHALKIAEDLTRDCTTGAHLTMAVAYDGRLEIVDALRSLLDAEARSGAELADVAARLTDDAIAAHLYASGRPDPELIIRTSGEQRLSGFLLWQSVSCELYFCDANWPGFRRVDLLRALRDFARRRQRTAS